MSSSEADLPLTPNTIPFEQRRSKVSLESAAPRPWPLTGFTERLPRILAGNGLREVVDAVVEARRSGRPVLMTFGAHVIKCGLAPVLIELAEAGLVTAFATNGATLIHDSELGLFGVTSEDVEQGLLDGTFGMARETADFLNGATVAGQEAGLGLGEAVGRALLAAGGPHMHGSLLAAAARLGTPFTTHVAVGTDIIHMHPSADGAAIGETSLRDFRRLVHLVADLEGGVILNVGSAVVMPEVLLKAFALLSNQGGRLDGCLGVDLDMIRSYRSTTQVVERVRILGGRGIALTGHHEIMLPLLAGLLLDAWRGEGTRPAGLLDRDELAAECVRLRREGKRVVFTNGCFDLLHVGHKRYLEQARALGDVLVVGLNSDESVRRLKGAERPLVSETERAEMLLALRSVDYVSVFGEATPEALIRAIRPRIHTKGGDYTADSLPEAAAVHEGGGEVRILPLVPGRSTSRLAERIGAL